MELIRGKTFIKSSAPLNPDKPSVPGIAVGKKEDAGKTSSPPVIGELHPAEAKQTSLALYKNNKCSNRATKAGPKDGIPASGASSKPVPKSKTHDCVIEKSERSAKNDSAREESSATVVKIKGRLVGSSSFSGVGNHLSFNSKGDSAVSPCQSTCSQKMIDYRDFVPQVPFVPAVAKSIPRKRISLKRSKKGLRDIFHIKKNKQESLTPSADKDKGLPSEVRQADLSGRRGAHLLKTGEAYAIDCLAPEVSDGEMHYDPSHDYCNLFCEDAASLKSFDSLTGCGEIFADESSAHVEFLNGRENHKANSVCKRNPASESFQGGMEQLASPAQSEAIDFAKFWGRVNRSVRLHQNALLDKRGLKTPNPEAVQSEKEAVSIKDIPLLADKDLETPKDSSPDTETPKSDLQESTSTSDEGYYDSFSPGLDDEKKETPTPGTFPRDSYSGDALYELFYDHSETQISPILDDELSMSGQTNELPLSICSFHVGAEENMASQPSIDMVSQGFLQSSWKGKDCLLKLCDTELSLTMGIINWLRNNPGMVSPISPTNTPRTELRELSTPMVLPNSSKCQQTISEKQFLQVPHKANTYHQAIITDSENDLPTTVSEGKPEAGPSESTVPSASKNPSKEEENCTRNHDTCLGFQATSTICPSANYSDQQSTFHGHKLRVCSPEMVRMAVSDQFSTPRDNPQVMVAITKENLCSACRNSLERDESDLELCSLCMAKLQRMDAMPVSGGNKLLTTGNTNPLPKRHSKGFTSSSYTGRDQTIVQILEQCVAQVASLQISYKSEEKNMQNKCIGNEMKNILCKMSQYRKNILFPGKNTDEARLQENRLYTTLRHNVGENSVENQKNRTFGDGTGQHIKAEVNLEDTQMSNQFHSYRVDTQIQFCPEELTPVLPPSRPTFLPLFGCVSSDGPSDFLPMLWQMHNSQDQVSECNRYDQSWKLPCRHTGLPETDATPLLSEATPSEEPRNGTSSE